MGRPVVGLLYNQAVPEVIRAAGSLVDAVEVIPERFWYDFGPGEGRRFQRAELPIAELHTHTEGSVVIGHGIGLSLPSAMDLDRALVTEIARFAAEFDLAWYSEHLSMFLTLDSSVPNAQAGLGLPVAYVEEQLAVLTPKVAKVAEALDLEVLMENGTIFTPLPDVEMSEPEFFGALGATAGSGMLLDLHNLYANVLNTGLDADTYLTALDTGAVKELHLAGGDRLFDFYMDSHSGPTPEAVWDWAERCAPHFPNLRAITYEFHESYFPRLGLDGVVAELEQAHTLADRVAAVGTRQ